MNIVRLVAIVAVCVFVSSFVFMENISAEQKCQARYTDTHPVCEKPNEKVNSRDTRSRV